jgi:hypothetical protein
MDKIEQPQPKDDVRRKTLKELLLSDENRFEIDLPPRGQWKFRPIIRFEDD